MFFFFPPTSLTACVTIVQPRLSRSHCLASTHRLQVHHCESKRGGGKAGGSASAKCVYINVNVRALSVCSSEIDYCCALESTRTLADVGKRGLFNQRHVMEACGSSLVPPRWEFSESELCNLDFCNMLPLLLFPSVAM